MNHLIMNLLQIINKNCDRMKDEIANTMKAKDAEFENEWKKANKASNSFMGWPEDTNLKPVMWSSRNAAFETIQAVFQSKYTIRDVADFIDGLKALGLLDWKAEKEINAFEPNDTGLYYGNGPSVEPFNTGIPYSARPAKPYMGEEFGEGVKAVVTMKQGPHDQVFKFDGKLVKIEYL